jgi:hypothetical protein
VYYKEESPVGSFPGRAFFFAEYLLMPTDRVAFPSVSAFLFDARQENKTQ